MIEWQFLLDSTEIEEPQGFSDIAFNISRDPMWHGITIEASTSSLNFYGKAADILMQAKSSFGVDAVVIFTANQRCEGETEWTEAISGKLNFRVYEETCGLNCYVRMNIEQSSCALTFKNRFDQKVNLESNVAFDKVTVLSDYDGLDFNMQLATQDIPISADASVAEAGDGAVINDVAEGVTLIRPVYLKVRDNSINTGELDSPSNFYQDAEGTFFITPQVLLVEAQSCIKTEFYYNVRLAGNIAINLGVSSPNYVIQLILDLWDGVSPTRTTVNSFYIVAGSTANANYIFDQTFSGSINIPEGTGIYAYIAFGQGGVLSPDTLITYNFTKDTSFLLTNTASCPPTDCDVFLVNETLARVTEAITDRCLTVKSDYYGRTDSEPYQSDIDGCGSLRVLTPGLKIRQAIDKQFFASPKELFEGLRPIDNIGFGFEENILRVEDVRYFYSGGLIMNIDLIPEAKNNIIESLVYSNLTTGYDKWEVKSTKGIDEINSPKEYRTGIKSVSNPIDIRSNLIASGYIIEDYRTQTLANSGNTDSAYDNDVFIICVERDAYGFNVEQDIADMVSNVFSPATVYNWRIRPVYNLMRWFKSIAQSYINLSNTASKLFFTQGAGNYTAEGMISVYDACSLESRVIAENSDISINDFKLPEDATPIYKPETINFTYPLSITGYQNIKSNPYGFFNVSCGINRMVQKCYIYSINFKPAQGEAEFTLIKSWQ